MSRTAEVVSDVTRLPQVAVVLFFVVGFAVGGRGGLLWAALCVFLTSGLSLAYLFALHRSGRVGDPRRISRAERVGPLRVVAGLYVFAFVLVTVLGGPEELRAMLLAFAGSTLLLAGFTPFTNPSLHVAGVAGTAVCIGSVFGAGWGLLAATLAVPVWWARYRLRRHSNPELLLGLAIGGLCTAAAFALISA
ncbi:hypothetical protein [Rubrobacter indicoceani]|uniref:hypothetical protein n=1 Tax=Rubrobacter indicoceani TaxID=2051957 RepID=UPI000E5C515B|nr:hypothetical protein [Rubrobacter indicoceani]